MKYYLYVKTSPFGLKYVGKTTKNPYRYMGSGKIWKRHINKHNLTYKDIITDIILETDDLNLLIINGIEFSIKNNIVESKEWANLRYESGDGGDTSKFIDYTNSIFHDPKLADRLNKFDNENEKRRIIIERTSKIDYNNPNRLKKIKENTDWEKWKKSIENRNTDYSKFLPKIHKNNKKPIIQYDLDDKFVNEFESALDASKILNVGVGAIRHCLTGLNKTAFGYKWKYKK
jgi:hypothetical protein